MRIRGSLFWGIVLILVAALLLLRQMGIVTGNIFGYLWPVIVILIGLWMVFGYFTRGTRKTEGQTVSVPLQNATVAILKLDHGAGQLNIHSGANPGDLLTGTFDPEVETHSRLDGDRLEVRVRHASQFLDWFPGDGFNWDISLNKDVSLHLDIDNGASANVINLSDLKVTDIDLDTGASSTELTLPANAGNTHVDIDTGASSLVLTVPQGVAARIRVQTGVSAVTVDSRFASVGDHTYQSADYATAANKVDITIDSGVGSVEIK